MDTLVVLQVGKLPKTLSTLSALREKSGIGTERDKVKKKKINSMNSHEQKTILLFIDLFIKL